MTDYCQEVNKEFMMPKNTFDKNEWFGKILNYSDFLKQPLTLGMFVPCKLVDSVWVISEEPLFYEQWSTHKDRYPYADWAHVKGNEYQEAKDRILFEDWKVIKKEKSYILITDGLNELSFLSDGMVIRKVSAKEDSYVDVKCLEDFFNNLLYSKNDDLYVKTEITLTPTAQHQIGL